MKTLWKVSAEHHLQIWRLLDKVALDGKSSPDVVDALNIILENIASENYREGFNGGYNNGFVEGEHQEYVRQRNG